MKAFANIKSRYAEYKALDSADKVKAWKEGLINNAIYLLIIIAVIYTYTQNSRFLSVASIVNIISLSAANIPIACGIAGTIVDSFRHPENAVMVNIFMPCEILHAMELTQIGRAHV